MKLREALILGCPSLELQRAAEDEISRLDYILNKLLDECDKIVHMGGRQIDVATIYEIIGDIE